MPAYLLGVLTFGAFRAWRDGAVTVPNFAGCCLAAASGLLVAGLVRILRR